MLVPRSQLYTLRRETQDYNRYTIVTVCEGYVFSQAAVKGLVAALPTVRSRLFTKVPIGAVELVPPRTAIVSVGANHWELLDKFDTNLSLWLSDMATIEELNYQLPS